MQLLYGIQGTGNGHLSRAREIISHLVRCVDVEVLISGTRHEVDLGLEVPTRYAYGLGFESGTHGGIEYWNTL
jgi:predicted glycosyltransferase